MSELERLRLSEIPAGRQRLREQHGNLLRVADYCHSNYLQVSAGPGRAGLSRALGDPRSPFPAGIPGNPRVRRPPGPGEA
uniref:Uncharacterized protein n=1 Tax=Geospiza parvula TaxID=87175 RepID=A0A8U8BF33_GEOPR